MKVIIANITWNSKEWKGVSQDSSGHRRVQEGIIPSESWNFDFENSRNPPDKIFGFAQFNNPPRIDDKDNLIIFYSNKNIVGFYGNAEILREGKEINKQHYNLIGDRKLSLGLRNVITDIISKGYLEDKLRVGQIGFNYLNSQQNILKILEEAISLNQNDKDSLENIKSWFIKKMEETVMEGDGGSPKSERKHSSNLILFGPPGTGKTYNTINRALEIINEPEEKALNWNDRKAVKAQFDIRLKQERIMFSTFHQSMSYEDFIEGIKPSKPKAEDAFLKYEIEPGIFKKISEKAKSNYENSKAENKAKLDFEVAFEKLQEDWENDNEIKFPLRTKGYDFTIIGFTNTSIQFKKASGGTSHVLTFPTLRDLYYGKIERDYTVGIWKYYQPVVARMNSYSQNILTEAKIQPYVLIIDEINRGNVSQIFGELITLIEEDKRLGKDEALELTLPYSKEKFSVPPNLHIIGTMNTADRSVEALDTALRRRFEFWEMPPRPELLKGSLPDIDLELLLSTINTRIEKLMDKDHKIGHAYFMGIATSKEPLQELKRVFQHRILPLMQEYFYGDIGKMALVIGGGFFEQNTNDVKFMTVGWYDAAELSERRVDKLRDVMAMDDDEFTNLVKAIYQ